MELHSLFTQATTVSINDGSLNITWLHLKVNYNVFTENLKIYNVSYQRYKGTGITNNYEQLYYNIIISVT